MFRYGILSKVGNSITCRVKNFFRIFFLFCVTIYITGLFFYATIFIFRRKIIIFILWMWHVYESNDLVSNCKTTLTPRLWITGTKYFVRMQAASPHAPVGGAPAHAPAAAPRRAALARALAARLAAHPVRHPSRAPPQANSPIHQKATGTRLRRGCQTEADLFVQTRRQLPVEFYFRPVGCRLRECNDAEKAPREPRRPDAGRRSRVSRLRPAPARSLGAPRRRWNPEILPERGRFGGVKNGAL